MVLITETEQKILKAASTVYREKGRDGARMEDIAREAGINKALLHYYFRSKEKLYIEVFQKELKSFFSTLFNSITPQKDFKELLKSFISVYIDGIYQNPQVLRFILWEVNRGGDMIKQFISELFQMHTIDIRQAMLQHIQNAIDKKIIRELDPPHLIFSIIGMSLFVFIAQPIIELLFPQIDIMDRQFLEKRKEEIFNLIWNGIKAN